MSWRSLALTGSATLLKLTAGTDDLVWLAPCLARNRTRAGKLVTVLLYAASVTFLVSIATVIGLTTNSIASRTATRLKRGLKVVAGSLLILYSAHSASEDGWCAPCGVAGCDGDASDSGDDAENPPEGKPLLEPVARAPESLDNIIVGAILVSLDDFTVYLVIAGSGMYEWYELIVGTLLGCLVLAAVVAALTENEAFAAVLAKLPAWLVLMGLGLYILAAVALGLDE